MAGAAGAHRTCEVCFIREKQSREKRFFARFPLEKHRCVERIKAVGKEDLAYLSIEKLHGLRHICEIHFAKRDFTKSETRLKKRAVPKLQLTSPPLPDNIIAEFLHINSSVVEPSESTLAISVTPAASPLISEDAAAAVASTSRSTNILDTAVNIPSHTPHPSGSDIHMRENVKTDKGVKLADGIDVTPRKKKLMMQLRKTKCTLASLKKSAKLIENVSSTVLKDFVLAALQNQKRKPQGKRWTLQNKISALAIFKRSPKAYRYLQHIMPLPSTKTLQSIFSPHAGLHS